MYKTYLAKSATVISSLATVVVLAMNKYPTPVLISIAQTDTEEVGQGIGVTEPLHQVLGVRITIVLGDLIRRLK